VAIYKRHDWRDAQANIRVAENFAHAAALARYAKFKGLALDLEPYRPIWRGEGGLELAPIVYREGRTIALGMRRAYPNITLILLPDAQHYWDNLQEGHNGGYGLSAYFVRGLLSTGFKLVVFAIEQTYKSSPRKVLDCRKSPRPVSKLYPLSEVTGRII
jgi:hypothetical protein